MSVPFRHRRGKAPVPVGLLDSASSSAAAAGRPHASPSGDSSALARTASQPPPAEAEAQGDIRNRVKAKLQAQLLQDEEAAAERRAAILAKLLNKQLPVPVQGGAAAAAARPGAESIPAAKPRSSSESSSSQDEDEEAARRAQLRARVLAQRQAEEELAAQHEGVVDVSRPSPAGPGQPHFVSQTAAGRPPPASGREDSGQDAQPTSSTSASEDDESSDDSNQLPRPMFVPKDQRSQVKSQAALEQEALARELALAEQDARHRRESRRMLGVAIKEEAKEEQVKARDAHAALHGVTANMPDDTDGLDEQAEFDAWKAREFARLEREGLSSDDEEEEGREPSAAGEAPARNAEEKAKHHRGAFFMGDKRIVKAVAEREQGEVLLRQQGLLAVQADKRASLKKAPAGVITEREGEARSAVARRKPKEDGASSSDDQGGGVDLDLE